VSERDSSGLPIGLVRILCGGSRGWDDPELIVDVLARLEAERGLNPLIVHGGARGADRMIGAAAEGLGYLVEVHIPDWASSRGRAGFIRNQLMVDLGAELCLAFWDGDSHGTRDLIARAKIAEIPTEIYYRGQLLL